MIKKFKHIGIFIGIVVLMVVTVNMMNFSSMGIENVNTEFQNLALKIAIGRLVIVGAAVLLGWGFISRAVAVYFRVEVGPLKYRVLFWYVFAEAVIIWSLLRM